MYDYFTACAQVLHDNVGRPEFYFSESELMQIADACEKAGLKNTQLMRKVEALTAFASAKVRFSGKQTRIRAD
jgi:hypothetical protein